VVVNGQGREGERSTSTPTGSCASRGPLSLGYFASRGASLCANDRPTKRSLHW
jgi:hypothetical protein